MPVDDPAPVDLIFKTDYDPDGAIRDVRLVNRQPPSLSAITPALLDELGPRWRDPDTPDVLVFRDDARYLIGAHTPDGRARYLHRLP